MFSVIIPLYNKELSIGNTIKSVLGQTFQDFEIIVVNDGSTDKSSEKVQEFSDSRIRIIYQDNQGVSTARNRGILEAKFEWIAFLDGDDLWEESHLEEIVQMMKMFLGNKVFVTSFEYSDGRNMFKHPRKTQVFKIQNYFTEALKEVLICTNTVVVNKNCFEMVGVFNPELSRGEDMDMWVRLAKKYEIVKSNKVTSVYRIEAENRATSKISLMKSKVYYLDLENAKHLDEKKYYKQHIFNTLLNLLAEGDVKNFYMLLRRYKGCFLFFELIPFYIRKKAQR